MKTMIYSGVHSTTDENRELVSLWGRLVTHLNPGMDILVFDSLSPFEPSNFLHDPIQIFRFSDNPGHLSRGGGDGAGRTFCAGIDFAAHNGYDYAVHLESDFFLAKPISQLVERMEKSGAYAAACYLPQYQFPEFGLCAMNVKRMVATDFVKRYDWQNAPKWPIPERRIAELLGDDLWLLPWYGTRVDHNQINIANLQGAFPYERPSWLTHVSPQLAYKFLEINEINV